MRRSTCDHRAFCDQCGDCVDCREEFGVVPPTFDVADPPAPVPMLLWCPACSIRHIDTGDFATRPHHTHACQACGMVWRPALVPTVGVQFLPGFKNRGNT